MPDDPEDDDPIYDIAMLEAEMEDAYQDFVAEGGLDQTFVLSEDFERQKCLDFQRALCSHGIIRKFCVLCHAVREPK